MIHCLEISEVLLAIFEGVLDGGRGNPDLAALARTCRSFSEPAISILWRTQTSMVPFFLCFPCDIIDVQDNEGRPHLYGGKQPVLKFARPPSIQDWERPLFYAKYIKVLAGQQCQSPSHSVACAYDLRTSFTKTLLDSCPASPLFPKLLKLDCASLFHHQPGYELISSISVPMYMELLFKMSNREALRLLSFTYLRGFSTDDARAWRARFIEHFVGVRLLKIVILSYECSECFVASAALPNLKSLRLHTGLNLHTFAPPSFASGNLSASFSALVDLEIDKFPVEWVIEILKVIQSSALSHIRITRVQRMTAMNRTWDFCGLIASRPSWRQSLRSVELSTLGDKLSSRDIEHLLVLKELRSVMLEGATVDDSILESMARAWPKLQQLNCAQHLLPAAAHTPALHSLVTFAKYCPDLKYLNIPLDASQIPTLVDVSNVSHDQDATADVKPILVVRARPLHQIPDAANLADFLLEVFPRVRPHVHCVRPTPTQAELIWEDACKIVNSRLGRASGEEAIPWNFQG